VAKDTTQNQKRIGLVLVAAAAALLVVAVSVLIVVAGSSDDEDDGPPGGGGDDQEPAGPPPEPVTQWETFEITLEAADEHAWSDFPVQATFEHPDSGTALVVDGFWDGGRTWRVRFAPPLPGVWRWSTSAEDAGLDGHTGALDASPPTEDQVAANDNYRGALRVADNSRHLERADGTPFFWLGDTAWLINSMHCPLEAGPTTEGHACSDYLDDRVEKGFSVIGVSLFDIHAENEAGFPFPCNVEPGGTGDYSCLSETHFQTLDGKLTQVWERGLVAYANVSWLVGHMPNEMTTPEDAQLLARYLLARYGWAPLVLSLSGEYQYGYDTNGVQWTADDWDEYGAYVQEHNPHDHPVTVHPSSADQWERISEGAGRQSSSGEFHESDWLDLNSIQSGQRPDRLWLNPERVAEDYARTPAKPVLHAEGVYLENGRRGASATRPQLRWQAYAALLNGALGHTYGANGIWQMYAGGSPEEYPILPDPRGTRRWWEVMDDPSSDDLSLAGDFFRQHVGEWWELEPRRAWLDIAGRYADYRDNATDPHLAATADASTMVAFFGELLAPTERVTATDDSLARMEWDGTWFNPETGETTSAGPVTAGRAGRLRFPERPTATDWVLLLEATA
jgi:hypothetical protein